MIRPVIDTSVVMAVLLGESGKETATRLASGSVISSVNFAEVVAKCMERSVPEDLAIDYIRYGGIEVVDFDGEMAAVAGQLWAKAPRGMLSLGDRACIATAIRLKTTAVTADRVWTALDLGCKVELIR